MLGWLRCRLGWHDWEVLALCTTRAAILAAFTTTGGHHRRCRRCRVEDNDMTNCRHDHAPVRSA